MKVLVEPECDACTRAVQTATDLCRRGIVTNLSVINREVHPEIVRAHGVVIFPAIFINGRLAFYGEFSEADTLQFVGHLGESEKGRSWIP